MRAVELNFNVPGNEEVYCGRTSNACARATKCVLISRSVIRSAFTATAAAAVIFRFIGDTAHTRVALSVVLRNARIYTRVQGVAQTLYGISVSWTHVYIYITGFILLFYC